MLGTSPERFTECESEAAPRDENEPYVFVIPYSICPSALLLVSQVIFAVEVPTEAVSVFEIRSAGAGVGDEEVVVAVGVCVVVVVAVVVGVVVVAVFEFGGVVVAGFCGGGGVGSSGVASVVNVSSAVMVALPPASITITR